MDQVEVNTMQISARYRWRNSSIERVTRLQHHCVAWINAQHGWNVWVPAIVSGVGLLTETFAPINANCLSSHSNVLSSESVLGGAYAPPQHVSTSDAQAGLKIE